MRHGMANQEIGGSEKHKNVKGCGDGSPLFRQERKKHPAQHRMEDQQESGKATVRKRKGEKTGNHETRKKWRKRREIVRRAEKANNKKNANRKTRKPATTS